MNPQPEVISSISELRQIVASDPDSALDFTEKLCDLYEKHWFEMGPQVSNLIGEAILETLKQEKEFNG